jgi:hypothetical protein
MVPKVLQHDMYAKIAKNLVKSVTTGEVCQHCHGIAIGHQFGA